MKKSTFPLFVLGLLSYSLQAQVCDPSVAPTGLTSTYTPGSGALLEWDAVPGSVGVQLRVDMPSGSIFTRRIVGPEPDQYAVPEAWLSPGIYTWRIRVSCSTTIPYDLSPISATDSFTVGVYCPTTVPDIDGNVYNTVLIGSQCWMKENLKVEHYRNGAAIPTGTGHSGETGAYAVYDKATYGLLYNWYATVDPRGLCPVGWHIPTDTEWTELTDFLGGVSVSGGQMKSTGTIETGTGLWHEPNTDATNSSGFSGLPGGRRGSSGVLGEQSSYGFWWSTSEYSAISAKIRSLKFNTGAILQLNYLNTSGLSVRCLQN